MFQYIDKCVPARKPNNGESKIPRVIYQTHEEDYLPVRMVNATKTWIDKNPEYEYRFFDRHDRYEFIREHFNQDVLDVYLSIHIGSGLADLFRVCLIYQNGGVYSDLDQLCLTPLSTYLPADADCVTGIERNTPHQGFMAYSPKHPILKLLLEDGLERFRSKRPLIGPWSGRLAGYMGPPALDHAWKKWHHGQAKMKRLVKPNSEYKWMSIKLTTGVYTKNGLKFYLYPSLFQTKKICIKYAGYIDDVKLIGIKRWQGDHIFKKEGLLVVSTIFGNSFKHVYPAPNIGKCVFFTNNPSLKEEIIKKQWSYQYVDLPLKSDALLSSLQSKYVKFLQFVRDFPQYSRYRDVVYFDHKFHVQAEHIERLLQTKGASDILIRTTPANKTTIWDEVKAAKGQARYLQNMNQTIDWVNKMIDRTREGEGYSERVRICNTGLIFYSQYTRSTEFLDKVYKEITRLKQPECQIIWAILSQKSGLNIKTIPFTQIPILWTPPKK